MAEKIKNLDELKGFLGLDDMSGLGKLLNTTASIERERISHTGDDLLKRRYESVKEYLDEHDDLPDEEEKAIEKIEDMMEDELRKRGLES
jgi:hypothetical protein